MENNTPPISKLNGFARMVLLSICLTSFLGGIFLLPTKYNVVYSILLSIVPIMIFIILNLNDFFKINLKEFQVIKLTQDIFIGNSIIENISFSVQKRTFNVYKYEFQWIDIVTNLKLEDAISYVDDKLKRVTSPVTEVVYKKP